MNWLQLILVQFSDVEHEFKEFDQSDPNCVVIGDAGIAFTYPCLNSAFRLLMQRPGIPLITMGVGYLFTFIYPSVSLHIIFVSLYSTVFSCLFFF